MWVIIVIVLVCDDQRTVELLMYTQPLFSPKRTRVGSGTQDLCRAEKERVSSTSAARHGTAWVAAVVGDGSDWEGGGLEGSFICADTLHVMQSLCDASLWRDKLPIYRAQLASSAQSLLLSLRFSSLALCCWPLWEWPW